MNNRNDALEKPGAGVFGVLLGLLLLVLGAWMGWEFHAVWYGWPSLNAEAVGGEVVESYQFPTARGGLPRRQFRLGVELRYALHENEYLTKVWVDSQADTYEKARASLQSAYAPGSRYLIRYNPKDPTDVRFGSPDFSMLVFSVLLVAAGLVVCVMGASGFAMAYAGRGVSSALRWRKRAKASGQVSGIGTQASPGAGAAPTLHCPSCGRQVKPNEDTCPNCLKSLRAA